MSTLEILTRCLGIGLLGVALLVGRILWLKHEQEALAKCTRIRKGKFLRVTYPIDREAVQTGLLSGPREIQCTIIFFMDQQYLKITKKIKVRRYPEGTPIEVFSCGGGQYKVRKQEV